MMWIFNSVVGILRAARKERITPAMITPTMILKDARRLLGFDRFAESAVPSPEDVDLAMDEFSRLYPRPEADCPFHD